MLGGLGRLECVARGTLYNPFVGRHASDAAPV